MTGENTGLLQRLKVPLGPALADIAIVASLIFASGQTVQRFEMMDKRIASIEEDKLAQRAALSEQRIAMIEQATAQQRVEIINRLSRIEDKLDQKVDRSK